MLVDVGIHFALDMSGALSLWCLLKGCQNPAHQHNSFVRLMGRNPWIFQSIFALFVAIVTVKLVG